MKANFTKKELIELNKVFPSVFAEHFGYDEKAIKAVVTNETITLTITLSTAETLAKAFASAND